MATQTTTALDEVTATATAHGWTRVPIEFGWTEFRRGTRRIAVHHDVYGRIVSGYTARGHGPFRDTKTWALEVLRFERPSSPKR